MTDSLQHLTQRLNTFATDRHWQHFHTPKNLAMALAGEAGELLAELQWLTPSESMAIDGEAKDAVAAEMADVFTYLVRLASVLDIDLIDATNNKITDNERRYPPGTP